MAVEPWLARPALDNLKNLTVACFEQRSTVCEGRECTEMKEFMNTTKGGNDMIKVIFKNLDKSELAQEAALVRLESLIEKFPDLDGSQIHVTLEMQNSPHQAGPDLFTVRVHVINGRYRGVRLERSASSLYVALADLSDRMLERLNRVGDRARVQERNRARQETRQVLAEAAIELEKSS